MLLNGLLARPIDFEFQLVTFLHNARGIRMLSCIILSYSLALSSEVHHEAVITICDGIGTH